MKNKDILLVARPDHSMKIYQALLNQSDLSFNYITFKVVPAIVKKIIPFKKLQTVTRNCSIAIVATIKQVFKSTFKFRFAKDWKTDEMLSKQTDRALKNCKYKIVHFWPEYASSVINDRIKKITDTIYIADMYMPNPIVILDEMRPVYEHYGLNDNSNTWLEDYASKIEGHFKYVNNIMVASSYVADTMKISFPEKNYIIVPYGITISPRYKKKCNYSKIYKFVYVGRISVEKGCDILLDWFAKHQAFEVNLFGEIDSAQKRIFENYYKFDNVKFHGSVSKVQLRNEIPKCDIGIHLSRFDAYSLAVGEIIGCGVPVIVSDKNGIKDDVQKYGFGIVSKLTIEDVDSSIKKMCNRDFYQSCINAIDTYIISSPKSFGEIVVDKYSYLLQQHSNRNRL